VKIKELRVNRRRLHPSTKASFRSELETKTKCLFTSSTCQQEIKIQRRDATGTKVDERKPGVYQALPISVHKQNKKPQYDPFLSSPGIKAHRTVSHPKPQYRCVSPTLDRVTNTSKKVEANTHKHKNTSPSPPFMSASQPPIPREPPRLHSLISIPGGQ
jgi:hypothetical protein